MIRSPAAYVVLVVLTTLLCASPAYADGVGLSAGQGFMAGYAVFGGLVLAFIEGVILRRFVAVPRVGTMGLGAAIHYIIVAPVLILVALGIPSPLRGTSLLHAGRWEMAAVFAFVIGVPLAVKVASFAVISGRADRRRALRGVLIAHATSSAILVVAALVLTQWSLYRVLSVAGHGSVGARPEWVYYISRDGRETRRIKLDGTADQLVATASARLIFDYELTGRRLKAVKNETGGFDLVCTSQEVPLIRGFASVAGVQQPDTRPQEYETWLFECVGPAADLQTQGRTLAVEVHFLPSDGLTVRDTTSNRQWRIALDTVTGQQDRTWMRYATILDGGIIVCQLGEHDVLVIDWPRRRVSQLVVGASPVVAIPTE